MNRLLVALRQRKVFGALGAYLAGALTTLLAVAELYDDFGLPDGTPRAVAGLLAAGIPLVAVLAWRYDLRRDGASLTKADTDAPAPQGPGTGARGPPSIVVLPFDNISPDPTDAYLAEGLTEEITASLCALHDLRVTSRTSATVLKQAGKDTRAIGAELDVGYVLEGSVRKVGEALRITAQLIRAATDEHLWSERYDGTLADVFGMQEEVASSIVRILEVHLEPAEARRLRARPMDDLQAYESYLRAREAARLGPIEDLEVALSHLEEARERVGENAVVLAGIGYVYSQFANMDAQDRDYVALAEEHARKALAIDPDDPEAHMVLGFLYQEGLQDLDLSLHHLERSLALKPDDPHALTWWTIALSLAGRNEEMAAAAARLREVDPLNPLSKAMRGYVRLVQGELEGSVEDMEAWHRASPHGSPASVNHAFALAQSGRRSEAEAILREEFAGDARGPVADLARLLSAALVRDLDTMAAIANMDAGSKMARDLQATFWTASLYALAGSPTETLRWLRLCVANGFRNYPWAAENDAWLSRYRGDPEFEVVFDEMRRA
ncbi:MAG: hypothetical protein P8188_10975 [Gemmatimonadota bacterium]